MKVRKSLVANKFYVNSVKTITTRSTIKSLERILSFFILPLVFLMGMQTAANAGEKRLSEIKKDLLNQQVVIHGRVVTISPEKQILWEWKVVELGLDGEYSLKPGRDLFVPAEIRGAKGKVISVNLKNSVPSHSNKNDAFGKSVTQGDPLNPELKIVVELEDRNLISTEGRYSSLIRDAFQFEQAENTFKNEIERNLAELLGKNLYSTGFAKLIKANISESDLSNPIVREKSLIENPKNLSPLKIVDTRYLEDEGAIVLKVKLPDASEALLWGDLRSYNLSREYKATKLDRMGIDLEEKIPSKFSRRERDAIKGDKIIRGMSEDALYWTIGFPETFNDWGSGGKQYIYYRGTLYIYLKNGVVVDWQSINQ